METLENTIKKIAEKRESYIYTNADGIKYKFEHYVLKNVPNYLVSMFVKANKVSVRNYVSEDNMFTACLDLPKFKGGKVGTLTAKQVIIIN